MRPPPQDLRIINTFRYETKQTRSFIRVREIHFFEAHTAHADQTGADAQMTRTPGSSSDSSMSSASQRSSARGPSGTPLKTLGTPMQWTPSPNLEDATDSVLPPLQGPMGQGLRHHIRGLGRRPAVLPPDHLRNEREAAWGGRQRPCDDAGLIMPPSIAPIQAVVMPVASHLDRPSSQRQADRPAAGGCRHQGPLGRP